MATPNAIMQRALRLNGALGIGETMEAAVQTATLEALNALLDSWRVDGLLVHAVVRQTKVLTASDGGYSIGAGGDIVTTEPVEIENASIIASGETLEIPIKILTADQWARLADKTTEGLPYALYYQRASTAVTGGISAKGFISLYFVPDDTHTLVLYLAAQLAQIALADVATDYTLPPGYLDALVYSLAIRIAIEDGKPPNPSVQQIATDALAAVKLANHRPLENRVDSAFSSGGRQFDIRSGDN